MGLPLPMDDPSYMVGVIGHKPWGHAEKGQEGGGVETFTAHFSAV